MKITFRRGKRRQSYEITCKEYDTKRDAIRALFTHYGYEHLLLRRY